MRFGCSGPKALNIHLFVTFPFIWWHPSHVSGRINTLNIYLFCYVSFYMVAFNNTSFIDRGWLHPTTSGIQIAKSGIQTTPKAPLSLKRPYEEMQLFERLITPPFRPLYVQTLLGACCTIILTITIIIIIIVSTFLTIPFIRAYVPTVLGACCTIIITMTTIIIIIVITFVTIPLVRAYVPTVLGACCGDLRNSYGELKNSDGKNWPTFLITCI